MFSICELLTGVDTVVGWKRRGCGPAVENRRHAWRASKTKRTMFRKITSKIPRENINPDRYDECVDAPIKIGDQEGCTLMMSQMSGKNTTADKNRTHCVTKTGNLPPPNVDKNEAQATVN